MIIERSGVANAAEPWLPRMARSGGMDRAQLCDVGKRRKAALADAAFKLIPATTVGQKCPAFTMIWAYTDQHLLGRAAPMATLFQKTTDEEYEERLRNLARFVSACTLGLWSFAAGLLIGTFYLF
jgi:hypothetical protein